MQAYLPGRNRHSCTARRGGPGRRHNDRAYLLMASEQYDKAAEDLQAICEARASIYGNYSIQVIKAKQNLVTLYTKKGDKESLLRTYR